jgi:PAS domain S-box-containing protein
VQPPPTTSGQQAEVLDRLARLQALTASLSQAVTSEQVADAILSQGLAVLGANAGCVTVLSDDRTELLLLCIAGAVEDVAQRWQRFPLTAPVPLAEAIREQRPVVLETFAERLPRYPALAGVVSPDENGAMVALPMVVRGEALGSLGWGWPNDRHFTAQDQAFLLTLAELCGQALDRARLYDRERAARERAERAEASLRESEQRLRAIIDNCPSAIFVKDPAGRYLLANQACQVYSSEPVERVLGKTAYDYFPRELAENLGADDRRVLATGEVLRCEAVMPVPGGTQTALTVKFPLRDASGRPYAVCGIATDITELRRAAEALRKSEDRFVRFMQHLPGLAWIKDEQGRYVYANDVALKAFGMPRDALCGRTDEEIFPPATAAQFRENDQKALASGAGVRVVETLEHEDGVLHHSLVSKFPIPGTDGGSALVGGMAIDITEERLTQAVLEESEERFRATFEQAAVGIAHVGPDGRWLRVNRKLCDIVGYGPDELVALTFQDITHPEDLEADLAQVRRLLAGEIATYSMEKRYFRKDGSLVWINLTVSLVRTPRGQPKYFISVVEDDTDRKALEDRLRDQAEQLRQADRRKDEFLATLAHELRNPLAPLWHGLGLLQLAGDDRATAEKAQAMMERQLAQMVRLIDDLLDVSRITRGKLELRRERVELASVIQSAVEGSRPLIEASGHELTIGLPSEPIWLDADPTRLAEVFANLLTNAAKYTDGGGHVWLTAERSSGEVIVTVRDTGIGIAHEHLPRLFEMFSQVAPALERSQGGLGIGLSLVKGLIEMHGGSVAARSEGLGKGSEFIVRLPLAAGGLSGHESSPAKRVKGARAPTCRILVADDNRDAVTSLTLFLRLEGHEVHAAHDGQEAVEAAAWFRPELCLLDIGMPKLNGLQVARHIRSQPWGKNVVLVAITGWGQQEDKRRATEAGFDYHLTKPVDPAALEQMLSELKRG